MGYVIVVCVGIGLSNRKHIERGVYGFFFLIYLFIYFFLYIKHNRRKVLKFGFLGNEDTTLPKVKGEAPFATAKMSINDRMNRQLRKFILGSKTFTTLFRRKLLSTTLP